MHRETDCERGIVDVKEESTDEIEGPKKTLLSG